nr:uncharacterized protein LOC128682442 [Plodia interpunctella]
MKLTEEETCRFVMIYKSHECLYDGSHPNYKCKYARAAAIQEMVEEVAIQDITADDVKKKIKSLRSTYFLEWDKIQKFKNRGITYKSRLKWFDLMNSVIQKYSKRSVDDSPQRDITPEADYEMEGKTSDHVDPDSDPLTHKSDIVFKNKEKNKRSLRTPKKFKRTSLMRGLKKEIPISNVDDSNENEFDIYGRYVAASLKKLSCQQAIYAQNQINNILTTAKMHDHLLNQNSLTNTYETNDDNEQFCEEEYLEDDGEMSPV